MCCVMGYTGHDLSAAKFKEYLLRTVMRGPDDQRVVEGPFGLMGFGRLAIMGLTPEGMQPFYRGADCVVCNGELYGFRFDDDGDELTLHVLRQTAHIFLRHSFSSEKPVITARGQ